MRMFLKSSPAEAGACTFTARGFSPVNSGLRERFPVSHPSLERPSVDVPPAEYLRAVGTIFDVIFQACQPDRADRFASMALFYDAGRAAQAV